MRRAAETAIASNVNSTAFAQALDLRLHQVPLEAQLRVWWVAWQTGGSAAILRPRLQEIFESKLASGSLVDQIQVAYALMALERPKQETVQRLVQLAAGALDSPARFFQLRSDPENLLASLGDLGPIPERDTAPLRRLLGRVPASNDFQLGLVLTRLNPSAFPAESLFQTAPYPLNDRTNFELVFRLLNSAVYRPRHSENLGSIVEAFLRSELTSNEEFVVSEKVSTLMAFANRASATSGWVDSILVGLDNRSRQVRMATAWTLFRLKAHSPAALNRVAQQLQLGRDPEWMLLILSQARSLPGRVESLVRALAAGEIPKDWTPELPAQSELADSTRATIGSKSLQQLAQGVIESLSDERRGPF
jgi:hypothetical protein